MIKKSQFKRPRIVIRTPRVNSETTFSYKEYDFMAKFVTEQGYIVGRSRNGLSQKQQRQLARETKRARQLALIPFTQTVR
jgi:small subunit ribosomal protein S18